MDLPMSGRPSTGARHPTELGGEVLKARLAHPTLQTALSHLGY